MKVIKRNQLARVLKEDIENSPNLLTVEEVDRFYVTLMEYAHAEDEVKRVHIERIKVQH